MRTRPVWILPNNNIATYPLTVHGLAEKKGLIYKADATFWPLNQNFDVPNTTQVSSANARNFQIKQTGIKIKPSPAIYYQYISGDDIVWRRGTTLTSYMYLKEPTLIYEEPSFNSTEDGDVINPALEITWSNARSIVGFGFRFTDDPLVYYNIDTLSSDSVPVQTATSWERDDLGLSALEGKKINFAMQTTSSAWQAYAGDHYIFSLTSVHIDMNSSWTLAHHTLTVNQREHPNDRGGYTTIDVPSWIIGPDTTRNKGGYRGHIEYSDYLPGVSGEYIDLAPWDF